ncbi:MAG: SCP2 sterol-binding domain-containing protein [Solirubrobacterales bacterium]|nr:SCP2 sterol-binding domain-containing protein [Solirubrobacterales bacterium]
MTGAPDFVEPVLGYRAWHVDDDGLLRPWTFTALPWAPGVNTAVCARDKRHAPPVADCMCGLYALSEPGDRRLHLQGDQAVGAVAAWGELEVHRTGFRAEHACVVALALPEKPLDEHRERLARAAARYGVPLVPASLLSAEAQRHGAPLPADLWGPAWPAVRPATSVGSRVPEVEPGSFAGAARGIAMDAHVWVETGLGAVVVGATAPVAAHAAVPPLAARFTPPPAAADPGPFALPHPGEVVAAGDRLVALAPDLALHAPVSGRILAVNPKLAADPSLLARDPEGAGWLVRLAPSAWEREAPSVTWGPAASRHYAACLARDAEVRGDPFADARVSRLRAVPPVRSARDVLRALQAERAAPRFADAAAVHTELGGRLRDALAADPDLRAALGRLDAVVAFTLRVPAAALVLDLRDGGARLAPESTDADLVLSCTAEDAYRWFTGSLDAAAAVRSGELRSSAELARTLRTLAVLKHLRIDAWTPAPTWAR